MKKFGKLMLFLCTASLLAVGMTAFAACDDSDSATDGGSGSIADGGTDDKTDGGTGGNENQNAQSVAGKLYVITDVGATGTYEAYLDNMKSVFLSGSATMGFAFGTDGSAYMITITQEASCKDYFASYVQNGNEITVTYTEDTETNGTEASITITDIGVDVVGSDAGGSLTYHCTYSGAFDPDAFGEMYPDT